MDLSLHDIGKRFNRRWIIRHVELSLPQGSATVILGANGSGKSTLLRMISGYLHPSEGERRCDGEKQDHMSADHQRMSYVAPYVDVYREMTLKEAIDFHFKFKKANSLDIMRMMEELDLPVNRELKDFSSGMLQRVKLALAFCSDDPVLLLDEPLMNLDSAGASWYESILRGQKGKRTIIVASNEREEEFALCDRQFAIEEKRLVHKR